MPVRNNRQQRHAPEMPAINWRWVIAGAVLLVISSGVIWLSSWVRQPGTFPLQTVRVEGQFNHLTAEQIKQAVLPLLNGGFFNIDVEAIKAETQKLPWVSDISVRRIWPDGLRILVTEQEAYARWNKSSLLNSNAHVFTPDIKTIPSGLPQLEGPDGSEVQVLSHYREFQPLVKTKGLKVARLNLNQRYAWQVELENGMTLLLGRKNSRERLERFLEVYEKVFVGRDKEVKYVDLRYSNGFAIQEERVSKAVVPNERFRG